MEEVWPTEKCNEKFRKAEEGNQQIRKEATLSIVKQRINDKQVVFLLNTNRSISIVIHALFEASKSVSLHFPLED